MQAERNIRISAVSYFNSQPFIYGLRHSKLIHDIELFLDVPSECARKLLSREADIGLVPVAVLPFLKDYRIISDFCIGAKGAVKSVYLFSNSPLTELHTVYLDHHSKTSNMLVQILSRYYWNINPVFINPGTEITEPEKGEAFVKIGDRAFGLDHTYTFSYDLSAEWVAFSGLPFVFAVWVSMIPLKENFIAEFNAALQQGLDNRHLVTLNAGNGALQHFDPEDYLQNRISYEFDSEKKKALRLFLRYLENKDIAG